MNDINQDIFDIFDQDFDQEFDQEVVGKDGLDTTTGEAALYTTTPAWHGLGQVMPGGTSDIDTVLKLAKIDWNVEKLPVRYGWGGALRTDESKFVTVRGDTGNALGVVGTKYHVFQNRDAFEFLQDLVADHGVVWESAGALRNGSKVFVSMRLPSTVTVDAEGINDEIIPFVMITTSHDGSGKIEAVVTPWRPVCANTERFALRDAHTRWGVRHTRSSRQRLDEARQTLRMSSAYFDAFRTEEEQLTRSELAMAEYYELIDTLWKPPTIEDGKRAHTIASNRKQKLEHLFTEPRNFPGTAYGAERALTEYLDHRGNVLNAVRATRLVEGADDASKSRAHALLMRRVR